MGGVKADKEENSPLAGAIGIMPGNKSLGICDVISNMMMIGPPPFCTKEKVNYGPNGDKRLMSMFHLTEKRSKLMKDFKSNYIYIQVIGVLGSYHGKGLEENCYVPFVHLLIRELFHCIWKLRLNPTNHYTNILAFTLLKLWSCKQKELQQSKRCGL